MNIPPLKNPFAQVESRSLVGLAATASLVVLPASSIGREPVVEGDEHGAKGREIGRGADRAMARDDLGLGPRELEDVIGGGDHATDPAATRGVDIGVKAVGEKVAGVDHVVRGEVHDQIAVGVRGGTAAR